MECFWEDFLQVRLRFVTSAALIVSTILLLITWTDSLNALNFLRMDENSKLIVVEGAHAIGKSKFAQELADDLDMEYFPMPRITDMLIDPYGVDLRQYNDLMLPINKVSLHSV